jgi:hypothetical protein
MPRTPDRDLADDVAVILDFIAAGRISPARGKTSAKDQGFTARGWPPGHEGNGSPDGGETPFPPAGRATVLRGGRGQ